MITDERPTYRELLVLKWSELFKETGNPIYAWRAYQNARRLRVAVPDEVIEYLDDVADGVIGVAIAPPPPKDRPMALARALKLGKKDAGPGSPFTEYTDRQNARKIALKAFQEIESGATEYAVFDDLGQQNGMSGSTVRRIYLHHCAKWHQRLEDLKTAGAIELGHSDDQGKPQVKLSMTAGGTADDLREAAVILTIAKRSLQ
jgi:hypothetical protein